MQHDSTETQAPRGLLARLIIVCGALGGVMVGAIGCSESSEASNAITPASELTADAVGYDSVDDLLSFLRSMKTADDRVAMMDLLWSRSLSDAGTARIAAQVVQAQRDYVHTLGEKFDGATSPTLGDDLGIIKFAKALDAATISEISPSRRSIDFTDDMGQERHLVAVQVLGKWRLHATSIKNGEPMVEVWFHPMQSRLRGIARRYGDIVQQINDGEITSVEDAESGVRKIIGDGPALYGGLEYLTIDASLEPEVKQPQTNVRSG